VFKKLNINDSAVEANVSCTRFKFFSSHLKTNFLWLIKVLTICILWNTSTGQELGQITLEFTQLQDCEDSEYQAPCSALGRQRI